MSERFTDRLKAAAEPHWSQAVGHRFTAELAADSLPDSVYRRYLIQDYAFLDALARLVAMTIAAAPGMAPKSRLAAFLAAVTGDENHYFLRSFEALGVDESAWREAEPNPVTGALEEVMMAAGRSGDYAKCLSVLLPAEWIYLSWAQAASGPAPARFYLKEWIDLHVDPSFAAFVGWLRTELDDHGGAAEVTRKGELEALFRRVAELEVAFFEAAYGS
ncbi:MAG: TenA family protein [Pseudomonadota bacterium]